MLCLSLAAGMLTWGRILLQGHLTGWRFVVYWTLCAILAAAAVALSVIDIMIIRRRLRQTHQQLVTKTFDHIRNAPPE